MQANGHVTRLILLCKYLRSTKNIKLYACHLVTLRRLYPFPKKPIRKGSTPIANSTEVHEIAPITAAHFLFCTLLAGCNQCATALEGTCHDATHIFSKKKSNEVVSKARSKMEIRPTEHPCMYRSTVYPTKPHPPEAVEISKLHVFNGKWIQIHFKRSERKCLTESTTHINTQLLVCKFCRADSWNLHTGSWLLSNVL